MPRRVCLAQKKRPPSLTGAKLPWFSRVARALLAANGGVAVGAEGSLRGVATQHYCCSAPVEDAIPWGDVVPWAAKLFSINLICTCWEPAHDDEQQASARSDLPEHCWPPPWWFRDRGIAESHCVHTVDGNFVFSYEVALNSRCLALRARDSGCPCTRRTSFNFDDVSLMTFQALRHVIKLGLRIL